VRHSDTVAALLRELGQQLAALRREAGLTQENLGALAGFSRSTVSVAEIGRQPHAREFWAACDKALDSGGVLAAGFDQIGAVREAEERAAACAAQEARETRALAALTAAQHRAGVAAGHRGPAMPALRLPGRGPHHPDPAASSSGDCREHERCGSQPGCQDGRARMLARPAPP
jgi:transcriptional regulator with XRE-family HTH domain